MEERTYAANDGLSYSLHSPLHALARFTKQHPVPTITIVLVVLIVATSSVSTDLSLLPQYHLPVILLSSASSSPSAVPDVPAPSAENTHGTSPMKLKPIIAVNKKISTTESEAHGGNSGDHKLAPWEVRRQSSDENENEKGNEQVGADVEIQSRSEATSSSPNVNEVVVSQNEGSPAVEADSSSSSSSSPLKEFAPQEQPPIADDAVTNPDSSSSETNAPSDTPTPPTPTPWPDDFLVSDHIRSQLGGGQVIFYFGNALHWGLWGFQQWTEEQGLSHSLCDVPSPFAPLVYEIQSTYAATEARFNAKWRSGVWKGKAPCRWFDMAPLQRLITLAEDETAPRERGAVRFEQGATASSPIIQQWNGVSHYASLEGQTEDSLPPRYTCLIDQSHSLQLLRLRPSIDFGIGVGSAASPQLLNLLSIFRSPDSTWALRFEGESIPNFPHAGDERLKPYFNYTSGNVRSKFDLPFISYLFELGADHQHKFGLTHGRWPPIRSWSDRQWENEHVGDSINNDESNSNSSSTSYHPTAPLAMLLSNCGTIFEDEASARSRLAGLLMKHLPIDSFGRCHHTRDFPDLTPEGRLKSQLDPLSHQTASGFDQKRELISHYMFTFSVENSQSEDYITEKLWQPLWAGSVPVYMGAPRVRDFLPCDHCILDIHDFGTDDTGLKKLAERILYLARNETAYNEYHAWRTRPVRPIFAEWSHLQFEFYNNAQCAFTHLGSWPQEVKRLQVLASEARIHPAEP